MVNYICFVYLQPRFRGGTYPALSYAKEHAVKFVHVTTLFTHLYLMTALGAVVEHEMYPLFERLRDFSLILEDLIIIVHAPYTYLRTESRFILFHEVYLNHKMPQRR